MMYRKMLVEILSLTRDVGGSESQVDLGEVVLRDASGSESQD